jgi:hypothetical protein
MPAKIEVQSSGEPLNLPDPVFMLSLYNENIRSGKIKLHDWQGEDSDDRGVIYANSGQIESVEDAIDNSGPSWARKK